MATVEEKIAFRKAQEMEPQQIEAFLKAVPSEYLWNELRRRDDILTKMFNISEEIRNTVAG